MSGREPAGRRSGRAAPPRCGDSKIDGKEECDGKNFGGKTCTNLGFTGGNLACKTCKRDTSGCYKIHDPKGLAIAVGSGDQMSPAVTFGGNNFLVVWVDHLVSNQDIRGTRVSKKGAVLNTPAIPISINASNQTEPAVAAAGTSNYLVVWSDNRSGGKDIYGARISTTGSVMDNAGFLINSAKKDQKQPAATFHNSTYLVAWSDDRNESPGDIYGARVNTGGTVLDALGIAISSAKAGQQRPSAVWGQVDYMVVWDDTRDGQMNIYGAQVNPLGSVQDPTGKSICTAPKDQQAPVVAYDGSDYLVVWTDKRGATQDIYGTRIDGSSKVLDASGIAISKAANSKLYPAVAAGKTGFLVVWEDHRKSGDPNIYGARVNRAGEVLDPGGMPISTAAGRQSSPDIAFDGTPSWWCGGRSAQGLTTTSWARASAPDPLFCLRKTSYEKPAASSPSRSCAGPLLSSPAAAAAPTPGRSRGSPSCPLDRERCRPGPRQNRPPRYPPTG